MAFAQAVPPAVDKRHFRANFPNLFGGVIVLPEMPRHHQARVQYRG